MVFNVGNEVFDAVTGEKPTQRPPMRVMGVKRESYVLALGKCEERRADNKELKPLYRTPCTRAEAIASRSLSEAEKTSI